MRLPVAPDSVLSFVTCSCQKGCCTNRCSCKRASLKCSDFCCCVECLNSDLGVEDENEHVSIAEADSGSSDSSSDESANDDDNGDHDVTSEWETSVLDTDSEAENAV